MSAPETDRAARPKKPLRRRLLRWLVILVVLGVILRVALPFLLPVVLDGVVAGYDLSLEYDDLSLSILGGEASIRGLVLTPREGGTEYARLDYARVDIRLWPLIHGQVHLNRVDIDGVHLNLERKADGSWPFFDRFAPGDDEPDEEPDDEPDTPADQDFSAPLRIDALQAVRLTARFTDRTISPAFEVDAGINVTLSHVGSDEHESIFGLMIEVGEVLDSARLHGRASFSEDSLTVDVTLGVHGLRGARAAPYLAEIGLIPLAEETDLRAHARIVLTTDPDNRESATADLELSDFRARADGVTGVRLGTLRATVNGLGTRVIEIADLNVESIGATATLTAEGAVQAVGFEFGAVESDGESEVAPAQEEAPAADSEESTVIRILKASIADVQAEFVNEMIEPTQTTPVVAKTIEVSGLTNEAEGKPGEMAAHFVFPGSAEKFLISGLVSPLTPTLRGDLTIEIEGLTPANIMRYCESISLVPEFERGAIRARVRVVNGYPEGEPAYADFHLSDVEIEAGEYTHRLAEARIDGMQLLSDEDLTRFAEVELSGLDSGIRIDEDGTLHLLGFRSHTSDGGAPDPDEDPDEAPASEVGAAVEFGQVTIEKNRVRIIDETISPPVDLVIEELSFTSGRFRLGRGSDLGKVDVSLAVRAPGYAKSLTAKGTIDSPVDETAFDLEIRGRGLNVEAAKPWLRTTGLVPEMAAANLHAAIRARIRSEKDGTRLDVAIRDVLLEDGNREHFRCSEALIDGVQLGPAGTRIRRVAVSQPMIHIRRGKDGEFHLLGFTVGTPPSAADAPVKPAGPQRDSSSPPTEIGAFAVTGATFALLDERAATPRELDLRLDAHSEGLRIEPGKTSVDLALDFSVPETGARITVKGAAWRKGETYHADVEVDGERIGGARLSALLPDGMTFDLKDGHITGRVNADVASHTVDGVTTSTATIDIENVAIQDGPHGSQVFGFERFRFEMDERVRRGDTIELVDIAEISLTGLKAEMRRDPDGAIRVLGLTLRPSDPSETPSEPPAEAEAPEDPIARLKRLLLEPPRLKIRKLRLAADRLAYIEETPGAEPLVIDDLVLSNPEPIDTYADPDVEEQSPLHLDLSAKARPFIEEISVRAELEPFAQPRTGKITLDLKGIRGPGFADALPSLARAVDLDEIRSGRFHAEMQIRMKSRWKDWLQVDIERGYEVDLTNLELSGEPGALPLFSCEQIEVSVSRHTDDQLTVSSATVLAPRGRIAREVGGLRVLGILIRSQHEFDGDSTVFPLQDDGGIPGGKMMLPVHARYEKRSEPEAPVKREAPAFEVNVDNLYVTGVDLDYADLTVNPPVHLPLRQTDFELRRFSTRTIAEAHPFRFQVTARSDKVALPVDPEEPRNAFDEIMLTGQIGLASGTPGWLRASIVGLELSNLTGIAKKADVTLTDGVLELGLGARFHDGGGMDVNSTIALRDLSLTDSAGGFIANTLMLPFTTDMVIFLLRDHNGTISFALGFTVPPDGMSQQKITDIAVKKSGELIARAAVKSPLRLTAGIVGIIGIGRSEDKPEKAVDIRFEDGDTRLTAAAEKEFEGIARRMRRERELILTLEHELGFGDVGPMEARSSPSRSDCLAIAQTLRIRQRNLILGRAVAVEDARASLAAGLEDSARVAGIRLRAIDRDLGNVSRELDEVLRILRPGADRRQGQRTRAGCVALGRMRIEELARRLRKAGISPDRIRYRRPRYTEPERGAFGEVKIQPGRRIDARPMKKTEPE